MARQILTFFVLFAGVMLLMRTCAPKEAFPPAVPKEHVETPDAADLFVLEDGKGVVVRLDRTGALASVEQDGKPVLRDVPRHRRAFGLLLKAKDLLLPLPPAGWESAAVPGGREFVYAKDGLRVTRRVLLAEGGLDLELRVEGAPEDVRGFELGGPSGVVLDGADGAEPFLFRRVGDDGLRIRTFEQQADRQEEVRSSERTRAKEEGAPATLRLHDRELVAADVRVHRFGLLGATHYVAIEDFDAAAAINFEAYLADRGDAGETREIETWTSLVAVGGGFDGTFRLRWAARADAALREPALAERLHEPPEEIHWLESETLRVGLSDRGAAVREAWLKAFSTVAGEDPAPGNWVPILRDGVPAGRRALTLAVNDPELGVDPGTARWEAAAQDGALLFRLRTPRGYLVEKRVALPREGGYHLEVEVRITPPPGETAEKSAKFRLVGPAGSYIEDSYRGVIAGAPPAGLIFERRGGDDETGAIEKIAEKPLLHQRPGSPHLLRTVGVRGGFFLVALVTEDRDDSQGRPLGDAVEAGVQTLEMARPVERPDGTTSRQSLFGYLVSDVPYEEGVARARYSLYAGPAATSELERLGIEDAVDFGFFATIGRGLMGLMKLIHHLVGSYGIAIVLMTLIVRALLLPVSYRTQLGMQRYSKRLQKIKPILDELEAKYKSNRQKLNQERMRVMREHKIGFPLGCLMIFLQIPIWFALFGALRVEFALRHQQFLWCPDLTMPDRLLALPFWPHWFNLLPILMLVLWVVQQKIAPQPGSDDPNVQAQMKMVKFMPYVFFVFLYNYAAALAVYMCVSSAWGIAEGRLVRKAVARLA